jgi:hypothetical protein
MYTIYVRIEREKIQGKRKIIGYVGMPASVCDLQAILIHQ